MVDAHITQIEIARRTSSGMYTYVHNVCLCIEIHPLETTDSHVWRINNACRVDFKVMRKLSVIESIVSGIYQSLIAFNIFVLSTEIWLLLGIITIEFWIWS